MKNLLISLFLIINTVCLSQVGINTTSPNANLEIAAGTTAEYNGILLPKNDEFPTTVTSNQDGMMIYITGNGSVTKGYWYYDHGSGWRKLIQGENEGFLKTYLNPKFPDGMNELQPVTVNLSLGSFTVPTGKNLYITSVYRGNAALTLQAFDFSLSLSYTLISNTRATYGFPTFNNPIIIGQQDYALGNCVINGFLVDATIVPIYANTSYTVPANKVFVYLTSNQTNTNPINEIEIDGSFVTNTGTNNSNSGNAEASTMPLFVDEGQIIRLRNGGIMNGYLIDK
ncbi:hypothetical protein [Nonlabens tegetincola]|uniref:hypothetical protein n=1 Tax=Nonlabens tegetincola TaxID=323273 RepID=UPI0030C7E24C